MHGPELAPRHRPGRSPHPPGPPRRGRGPAARQGPGLQALLPAARLHLARGDHRSGPGDGPCAASAPFGGDRLRAVELLAVLVDAELAAGDVDAAAEAAAELAERTADVPVAGAAGPGGRGASPVLAGQRRRRRQRSPPSRRPSTSSTPASSPGCTPPCCSISPAPASGPATGRRGARRDRPPRPRWPTLDVVLAPADRGPARTAREPRLARAGRAARTAVLARDGKWWVAVVRRHQRPAAGQQGPRATWPSSSPTPAAERHALDLVDRVEGVAPPGGVDRRALGDAGARPRRRARAAYRAPGRGAARRRRRGARGRAAGGGGGAPGRARRSWSPSWPAPSGSAAASGRPRRRPSGPG